MAHDDETDELPQADIVAGAKVIREALTANYFDVQTAYAAAIHFAIALLPKVKCDACKAQLVNVARAGLAAAVIPGGEGATHVH